MQTTTNIEVKRHPSEFPLLFLVIVCSIVIWVLLAISVAGILYVALLSFFFFIVHAFFISHVRGNGVQISRDQLPELNDAINKLATKFGFSNVPEAYLMQSGGVLNAMATKFFRSKMLIINSELLEACDGNTSARDMILGHELGHIKAGHLRWRWFLLPGMLVPFLGKAYSRAREYTCDRYGLAAADDKEGALLGLVILAAGKKYAPQVSRPALVKQINVLNTGWMRIGEWVATHPVISKRIHALDPALKPLRPKSLRGTVSALLILLVMIGILVGIVGGLAMLPNLKHKVVVEENNVSTSLPEVPHGL